MLDWRHVTQLGDSAVLVPLAVMLALGLLAQTGRQPALRWAAVFIAVGLTVTVSKLAYLGWGLGLPAVGFRGFSGHTALATTVYPAALWLLLGPSGRRASRAVLFAGLALGLLIGVSRLQVQAHTPSEVFSGFVLGAFAAVTFWRRLPPTRQPRRGLRAGVAVVYLLTFQFGQAPTQSLLVEVAQQLNRAAL